MGNLKKSDLQIAAVTASGSATRAFSMAHQMGLVKITRGSKAGVYNEKYYLNGEKSTYNWVHNAATSTVYSSTTFTNQTNKPYLSSNICYYIVHNTATISADNEYPTDDNGNGWTISSSSLGTVENGCLKAIALANPTLTAKTWTGYTIAIGDVFFADGSLAKKCSTYSSKKAVGMVISLSTSSTDKNTHKFTHGYVISATCSLTTSGNWSVSGYNSEIVTGDNGFNHYTGSSTAQKDANIYTFITTDMDGYTKCNIVKRRADYSASRYLAIGMADSYNTSVPVTTPNGICSGWYLPSSGQLYQYAYNFSGFSANYLTSANVAYTGNATSYRAIVWGDQSTAETAVMNWNKAFTDRGFSESGSNNKYTAAALYMPGSYWSCTEASATNVYNLCPWSSGLHIDGNDSKIGNQEFRTRPVLAF